MGRLDSSCSLDRALAMQGDELVLGPLSRQQERMDRRLPRHNFPLNLPTNRRLCSTAGGRIVKAGPHTAAPFLLRALSRRHYNQLGALEP